MKTIQRRPLGTLSALAIILLSTPFAFAQEAATSAPGESTPEAAPSDEGGASDAPKEEASAEDKGTDEAPAEDAPAEETKVEEQPAEEKVQEEEPKEDAVALAAAAMLAAQKELPPDAAPKEEPLAQKGMTEEEAAAVTKAREDKEYEEEVAGLHVYFSLNAGAIFGVGSTHGWNDSCPEVTLINWTPECSTSSPVGFVVDTRLGLRLSYFGVEVFAMGSGDWSSASLDGDPPIPLPGYATAIQAGRIGGGVGGGLRLMSQPAVAQISGGVGGGIMFRNVYTSVSSLDGSANVYAAPILRVDLTGTFFKLLNVGVLAWWEFSNQVTVKPDLANIPGLPADSPILPPLEEALGDVTVFDGTQFFIGPYMGFNFGG